ncbi:Glycosyltransferase, GT2 family [Lutibacter agarilyticus]|uniref:Glycosyltransferase, GT2 family n=1 Tax=Lutibacter agarilyticus TaxID=1109740 RepID=A0A238YXM5_9FLAO|nr:glycosyltransferase family A protein [Lutibacter agarilyticus]SNR75820.1 Glycosyltransferase, GT2 family [Lutibacter agarilyticus]
MIIVYHNNNLIVEVINAEGLDNGKLSDLTIAQSISLISQIYDNELLVWCDINNRNSVDFDFISQMFQRTNEMHSFTKGDYYFRAAIGYVDESLFINCNKNILFPTWQMSACVGIIHTSIINQISKSIPFDKDFDYYLNSVAKLAMPLGLFCYSNPNLLKEDVVNSDKKVSDFKLFRFVKQHYKTRWVFLLFLNLCWFEKTIKLFPLFISLFYKNRTNLIKSINIQYKKYIINTKETIDVIIPTIGRKKYLYDVLCDLRNQTHLPINVIIVEQNPKINSFSELDYITNESWPFTIKHTFTHQSGACNARNIALKQVESEWVFLNDDDNRFDSNLLKEGLLMANQLGILVFSTAYPQQNEKIKSKIINQSKIFGSGNSFVKSSCLKDVRFSMDLEFGYGEDGDFGMQLRNKGFDVFYLPELKITHLKAPIGGFRTKPTFLWSNEMIQPKPSPTVMLFTLKHKTKEQLKGYKTILFLKYYRVKKNKNPITYFKNFIKQWNRSVFWATKLMKTDGNEI